MRLIIGRRLIDLNSHGKGLSVGVRQLARESAPCPCRQLRYRAAASGTDDPEKLFDRQWALTVLERARARPREDYASKAKARDFEVLLPYLTPGPRERHPGTG